MKIIAKTFQGIESVLAQEIRQLGADDVQVGNRMVSFSGDQALLYRANICLRTAVRVLKVLEEFRASDPDAVYEHVRQMPWEQLMDEHDTFLVDAVCFSEEFRHSKFVAYRTKDAIADRFRALTGKRPDVSISDPTLRIHVHISAHDVCIALDASGDSLHKRGYRQQTVAAPINEVLAAAIVLLSGWKGDTDFVDPFCGSGTILIEAALIARNINPGLFRKQFAFERWRDFDRDLFDQIYNDDSHERPFSHRIYGYDINRQAVRIAQTNVQSAGVSDIVDVQQRDFHDFTWSADGDRPCLMITNPPYGERITTSDILGLYETIGTKLKQQFVGNDAWVISCHEACFDRIGMRPSTKYALYNGALPCELRKYQVFAGRLSDRRSEGLDIKSSAERERNRTYKPHRHDDDRPFRPAGEGRSHSRDDEHYFLSRPDGQQFSRRNFKWGDRNASDRRGSESDRPYIRSWTNPDDKRKRED